MSSHTTRIVAVRHAETVWNIEGRHQGHLDSPLTSKGEAQVRAVADRLAGQDAAALYTSDLAACGGTLRGRVTAKRRRILGGEDETMRFHCEESTTTKTASFRRNPSGARGFGPRALSFVGYDEVASLPPHFAPATRRPVRATPAGFHHRLLAGRFGWPKRSNPLSAGSPSRTADCVSAIMVCSRG